jgi:hypothetical protein
MGNKKYLDKVIGSLVRGTKLDYENNRITFPFYTSSILSINSIHYIITFYTSPLSPSFSTYCKNTFGLTDDEIEYVWKEYKDIILDKISKREP